MCFFVFNLFSILFLVLNRYYALFFTCFNLKDEFDSLHLGNSVFKCEPGEKIVSCYGRILLIFLMQKMFTLCEIFLNFHSERLTGKKKRFYHYVSIWLNQTPFFMKDWGVVVQDIQLLHILSSILWILAFLKKCSAFIWYYTAMEWCTGKNCLMCILLLISSIYEDMCNWYLLT